MDLVVDANVLFSAAIADGKTAELILRDDLDLYAPEYLFGEFGTYRETLLEKTHRDRGGYRRFVEVLKRHITSVPKGEFDSRLPDARETSPDPDDVPYFALAMHLDAPTWSDDRALGNQDTVPVTTTTDLIRRLE